MRDVWACVDSRVHPCILGLGDELGLCTRPSDAEDPSHTHHPDRPSLLNEPDHFKDKNKTNHIIIIMWL